MFIDLSLFHKFHIKVARSIIKSLFPYAFQKFTTAQIEGCLFHQPEYWTINKRSLKLATNLHRLIPVWLQYTSRSVRLSVVMPWQCLHQIGSCIGLPVLVVLIPTIRHCPESMVQGQLGVPGWVEQLEIYAMKQARMIAPKTTSLEKLKQHVLNWTFLMISKFQHLNDLDDRRWLSLLYLGECTSIIFIFYTIVWNRCQENNNNNNANNRSNTCISILNSPDPLGPHCSPVVGSTKPDAAWDCPNGKWWTARDQSMWSVKTFL